MEVSPKLHKKKERKSGAHGGKLPSVYRDGVTFPEPRKKSVSGYIPQQYICHIS